MQIRTLRLIVYTVVGLAPFVPLSILTAMIISDRLEHRATVRWLSELPAVDLAEIEERR